MNQRLSVRPKPQNGQSIGSYVNFLAEQNGYLSGDHMSSSLGLACAVNGQPLIDRLSVATDLPEATLQKLPLVHSVCGIKEYYSYGKLMIPSYHFCRERRVCSYCMKDKGYEQANWQIAWLPMCLEHRKFLISDEQTEEDQRMAVISDFFLRHAANEDIYMDSIYQVQKDLQGLLMREAEGVSSSTSVIEYIDGNLLEVTGLTKVEDLVLRKKRYRLKHFPLRWIDTIKFMEKLSADFARKEGR